MIQNADLGRNDSNLVTGVIEDVESNGDDRERNGPQGDSVEVNVGENDAIAVVCRDLNQSG
jgi:hypothetical protein